MKKYFLVVFVLISLMTELSMAQTQVRTQASKWRRNTAIVLFSGIGGSILGLSTLSFYGDPKEHTGNITMGALLGLMIGGGYVVSESIPRQAPRKTNDYNDLFGHEASQMKRPTLASVPQVQFEFSF